MASPLFEGLGLASGFGEDPVKPFIGKNRTKLDETADLRDYIANLVGSGSKTMDEDMKNQFGALVAMYGRPTAEKFMNHVFVFNNRNGLQGKSPKERLDAFYAIGSRDKELQGLMNKAKTFGLGHQHGFNESVNMGNKLLGGRVLPAPGRAIPSLVKAPDELFK